MKFEIGDKVQIWVITGFDSWKQQDIGDLLGGVVLASYDNGAIVKWENGLESHSDYSNLSARDWLTRAEEKQLERDLACTAIADLLFMAVCWERLVANQLEKNNYRDPGRGAYDGMLACLECLTEAEKKIQALNKES